MFAEAIKGEIVAALVASSANSLPAMSTWLGTYIIFISGKLWNYETSSFGNKICSVFFVSFCLLLGNQCKCMFSLWFLDVSWLRKGLLWLRLPIISLDKVPSVYIGVQFFNLFLVTQSSFKNISFGVVAFLFFLRCGAFNYLFKLFI